MAMLGFLGTLFTHSRTAPERVEFILHVGQPLPNKQLKLVAVAPSDACTPAPFGNGFAILSQTLPTHMRRLTGCYAALKDRGFFTVGLEAFFTVSGEVVSSGVIKSVGTKCYLPWRCK